MQRKQRVNVVSVWISVIFTVIAITLVVLFATLYHSMMRTEMRAALREQVEVLRDNADAHVVDQIENQMARRLASKDMGTGYIPAIVNGHEPTVEEIRALTAYFTEVRATVTKCERVELYFPGSQLIVGSQGVQFLNAPKYQTRMAELDYLLNAQSDEDRWLKRSVRYSGSSAIKSMITYVRPYPGVFPAGKEPILAISFLETDLMDQIRQTLRSLNSEDFLLLVNNDGVVWCTEEEQAVLADTVWQETAYLSETVELADGQSGIAVEAASASGAWHYVLFSPVAMRMANHSLVTIWAVLCVALLLAGFVMVLRVLMKHYHEPIQRLVKALPENDAAKKRMLTSPVEHLLQIESALSDMNKLREEKERFTLHHKPLLRHAWLNGFVMGEAHYTPHQQQMDIQFPYPHFQVVMCSTAPSEAEMEVVDNVLMHKEIVLEAFETREKETVLLFNHASQAEMLPALLEEAAEQLDQMGSQLFFGVGVFSPDEELVPASFRCARRALTSRYFEQNSRVAVFDPSVPHAESENAIAHIISQLQELTGLIRRETQLEVDQAIDSIVNQLRESTPYLNTMRSIMLLAALFLYKVVYDMKASPEEVYGENLLNAYYHIAEISEFSQRLKEDSRKLSAYLKQESSAGNRSVVQYAIHHIRNCDPSEWGIQSIADAVGISTGYLSRMFHQETGRKLVEYLQEVRMEYAARMLKEGTLSNEEICEKVGYSRLQYFAGKFKEHYGLSLNEYRRSQSVQTENE